MTDAATETWTRFRFHANAGDYRPVTWPPVGPYWCSGYGCDSGEDDAGEHSIVVAYAHSLDEIMTQWPEASNIDAEEGVEIEFSGRFPCPKWWDADARKAKA